MQAPKLTLIVPSLNQGEFLAESLESVRTQHYHDLELLLLDAGSEDNTLEVVQAFRDIVTYYRSFPDDGQTSAIAEGVAMATGDLIGWLNADDILLPGALEAIARTYSTHPSVGLVGGDYLLIDRQGTVIRCKMMPTDARWAARLGVMAVNQPGSFFSAEAYQRAGGLSKSLEFVMDTDLYLRMLLDAETEYVHCGAWLSAFRVHPSAKTQRFRQNMQAEHRTALSSIPGVPGEGFARRLASIGYRIGQLVNLNYPRMAYLSWRLRRQKWHLAAARLYER